jgi:transmembrane sensor
MTELHHRHAQQDARRRIVEQAAAWYLDLHDEPSETLRAEFLIWLKHSPAHVAEYLTISQLHGHLPDVAALDVRDAQQLEAFAATESPVVPLRRAASQLVASPALHAAPRARPRYRAVGGWMAVGVAVLVAALLLPRLAPEPLPPAVTYATTKSETRSVALQDGSLIQLGPDSTIAVRFDTRHRNIDLLQGNAVFDVGKDFRPLQVSVGANVLHDIGTVFDIQQMPDGHCVTVLSGRVDLLAQANAWQALWSRLVRHGDAGKLLAQLGSGQQVMFDDRGRVTGMNAHADTAQATAWLPHDIHFEGSPIRDVARRFNAYTTHPILIDDPVVAAIRISGRFHAQDPDSFLVYLAAMPGIQVEHGSDAVHIRQGARL